MTRLKWLLPVLILAGIGLLLTAKQPAPQQKPLDESSVFRLVSAASAQQTQINLSNYRIVKGNAKFLHNDTYLLCDSAAWNVDARIIEAFGNVKLIQDRTMLTSDNMVYLIDQDLARFSGPLVELTDKDGNHLRTRRLDYNTKDSTAVFERGASMKDKDGNVIESQDGTYDSKEKTFQFAKRVEIFMDSIFMKTDTLTYDSRTQKAFFSTNTHAWNDEGFISSEAGYYDRKDSTLNFSKNVYVNDPTYEGWAENVYYYRPTNVVEMADNVRILDTADRIVIFGNQARYERDSTRATITKDPAVVYYGETEDHKIDTLFLSADTVIFWGQPMCSFTSEEIKAAEKHRADALFDALLELRTKQAEERQKNYEDRMRAAGKLPPLPDSTASGADSTGVADVPQTSEPSSASDSTVSARDTVPPPPDSTMVKRLRAFHHAKVYRSDIQFCCDSLEFSELDSIAVLFGKPILWNKIKNQLTSETMHLLFKDGNMHRGSMLTDARITSMEDTLHFNQIRSTEMMGFFADNQLYRYDALGGVSAIFYMQEKHKISNVNIKQAKSLTAVIEDATAKRMLYLEEVKSDAYPLAEIDMEKQRLKGFEWRPDERPVDRYAITAMSVPVSTRQDYAGIRRPIFPETNRYYDNYMREVFHKQAQQKAEQQRQKEEQKRIKDSIAVADSLARLEVPADTTVAPADSAVAPALAPADSLPAPRDTVSALPSVVKDEAPAVSQDNAQTVDKPKRLTWKERFQKWRERRKARRAERLSKRAK